MSDEFDLEDEVFEDEGFGILLENPRARRRRRTTKRRRKAPKRRARRRNPSNPRRRRRRRSPVAVAAAPRRRRRSSSRRRSYRRNPSRRSSSRGMFGLKGMLGEGVRFVLAEAAGDAATRVIQKFTGSTIGEIGRRLKLSPDQTTGLIRILLGTIGRPLPRMLGLKGNFERTFALANVVVGVNQLTLPYRKQAFESVGLGDYLTVPVSMPILDTGREMGSLVRGGGDRYQMGDFLRVGVDPYAERY